MTKGIVVPVKTVRGHNWGQLSAFGEDHLLLCEHRPKQIEDRFSFAGGHRVQAWKLKKNVHWRPVGQELEISDVAPAGPPPRRAQRQR